MTMFSDGMLLGAGGVVPKEFVASASTSGAGATFTINKPAGVQTGDFMVAIIWGTGLLAASLAGWDPVGSDFAAAGERFAVMKRVVDGSEGSSFGFSTSNVTKVGHILAYRGISAVDLLGPRNASGSGTVMTAAAITATVAGILIASFTIADSGRTISSPPSGMTLVASHNVSRSGYVYDLNPSAVGSTGSKGATFSGVGADKAAFLMQIY